MKVFIRCASPKASNELIVLWSINKKYHPNTLDLQLSMTALSMLVGVNKYEPHREKTGF